MTVGGQIAEAGGAARDFADAHNRLLADRSIQFDLPPATMVPADQPQFAPPGGAPSLPDPGAASPAAQILIWGALAILVLFLLYWIARGMRDWRRKPEEIGAAAAAGWRPEAAPALILLGEADALAAEGLYGEAARLILHRSIADIQAHRPALVRPALTSRDIAGLPALPGGPRAAFARIAMLVERSLFARRALAADDWRDCRAAYEEFAFAESWRG
ncbi:MAG: hypothetical protein QOD42_3586 [Sphingomonadales bacterium]|jgi:hypothetical protein|nr:hypothetical protein [Sphingomonadales bacterium]